MSGTLSESVGIGRSGMESGTTNASDIILMFNSYNILFFMGMLLKKNKNDENLKILLRIEENTNEFNSNLISNSERIDKLILLLESAVQLKKEQLEYLRNEPIIKPWYKRIFCFN